MKRYLIILAAAIFSVYGFSSCKDDNTSPKGFGPEIDEIVVGPEGGKETIKVYAEDNWTATSSSPWVLISPNNGVGTAECTIRIDSSLMYSMRIDTVTFARVGETRRFLVKQSGFGKEIVIEKGKENIEIPYWEQVKNANFYVDVTANVEIAVDVENTELLKVRSFSQDVSNKAKLRTTRVYFDWNSNTKQFERQSDITIRPKNADDSEAEPVTIHVVQEAGSEITDDSRGDSLAFVTLIRNMGAAQSVLEPEKPLRNWSGVDVNDEGRITKIRISSIENQEDGFFPFELSYLRFLEEIEVWGVYSGIDDEIYLGPMVTRLPNLKKLTINASKITSVHDSLKYMTQLETLDLGHNNLREIPDFITPENFPNLRHLMLNTNQRYTVYDLSNNVRDDIGLSGAFPEHLLYFDSLETLSLGVNFFEGSLPTMDHWVGTERVWKATDDVDPALVGTPKVLPICKAFKINLNRFTGSLPGWILNHPNLCYWEPDIFIWNMEGKDSDGRTAKFDNVPASNELDCSWVYDED